MISVVTVEEPARSLWEPGSGPWFYARFYDEGWDVCAQTWACRCPLLAIAWVLGGAAGRAADVAAGGEGRAGMSVVENAFGGRVDLAEHVGLVMRLAQRVAERRGEPAEERIGWAYEVVERAARTWNPAKGRFSTHAFAAVLESVVRLPRETTRARRSGVRVVGTGRSGLGRREGLDLLREARDPAEARRRLAEAIAQIEDPQARRVLELIARGFGSLGQIGAELGVTRERVRQIIVREVGEGVRPATVNAAAPRRGNRELGAAAHRRVAGGRS